MRRLSILVLAWFACSCKSGNKNDAEEIRTYDTSTFYYDIPLALGNEINEMKRRFAFTYQITKQDNRRDSTEIDSTTFLKLAAPFLGFNLNENKYKKYYKEDRFEDGDTRSFVLNYTTNHPDLPVRSVSVLLDNESQHLKRIDIIKSYVSKDTTFEERLSWSAGRNFLIVQIANASNREFVKQTQVFWRDR